MLKEEKALRRLLNPDGRKVHKGLNDAITALVKAVREDAAKVAETKYQMHGRPFGIEIAIAIRRK